MPPTEYTVVGTLSSGQYFGEVGCVMGLRRTASVAAIKFTECMALHKDDLNRIIEAYPGYARDLNQEVAAFHHGVLDGSSAGGSRYDEDSLRSHLQVSVDSQSPI